MLLSEIKNIFHQELDVIYQVTEVDSFFYILIEHYLGLERFVLAVQPNLIVSKEKEQPLFEGLSQLKLERPVQYIIETAYFMEMDFAVNESVLIPRPETEELVRWVIDDYKNETKEINILDVGTGSGCIAVSLAKNLPKAKVYAFDVCAQALEIAHQNAVTNGVEVNFLEGDILKKKILETRFDIIVSNPPYVRESEKKEMSTNVLNHEPGLALFVSDEDPLQFYSAITNFATHHLEKGGKLYFEINQYLVKDTRQLLHDHNFSEIVIRKDLFGNDRMLKGSF